MFLWDRIVIPLSILLLILFIILLIVFMFNMIETLIYTKFEEFKTRKEKKDLVKQVSEEINKLFDDEK